MHEVMPRATAPDDLRCVHVAYPSQPQHALLTCRYGIRLAQAAADEIRFTEQSRLLPGQATLQQGMQPHLCELHQGMYMNNHDWTLPASMQKAAVHIGITHPADLVISRSAQSHGHAAP